MLDPKKPKPGDDDYYEDYEEGDELEDWTLEDPDEEESDEDDTVEVN